MIFRDPLRQPTGIGSHRSWHCLDLMLGSFWHIKIVIKIVVEIDIDINMEISVETTF